MPFNDWSGVHYDPDLPSESTLQLNPLILTHMDDVKSVCLFCCADTGPATVAFVDEVGDLHNFVSNVRSLNAYGGGNCPEYALDAILETLQLSDPDVPGVTLLSEGSQIIVLTDAGTLNPGLADRVISVATDLGVCIHFIYPRGCCCANGHEIYERIADETGGIYTDTLRNGNSVDILEEFVRLYRATPCSTTISRRKRQADSGYSGYSRCHTLHITSLASILRLVVQTDQPQVIVRKASGTTVTIDVTLQYASLSESKPEQGVWLACVESGTFRYTAKAVIDIDVIVSYLIEEPDAADGVVASSVPPPACKLLLYT